MDKNFMKLLEKKKGKELPEEYKNAKMATLSALHGEMSKMMGDDLKEGMPDHLKKVTVAAPDKEGLEEGMDKAKDLLGLDGEEHDGEDEESDEDEGQENEEGEAHAFEGKETPEEEEEEIEEMPMSEEEIDAIMHELQKKKAALLSK